MRFVFLQLLLLLMSTVALAQDNSECESFSKIIESAQSGFAEFRGPYDSISETYTATIELPGARECYIAGDGINFSCDWQFENEDEVKAGLSELQNSVSRCISEYKIVKTRKFPPHVNDDGIDKTTFGEKTYYYFENKSTVSMGYRFVFVKKHPERSRYVLGVGVSPE